MTSMTQAAVERLAVITLADSLKQLSTQLNECVAEGSYTLALGYAQLALNDVCVLKTKLERLAKEQRA